MKSGLFAALLALSLAARTARAQDADPWFGADKALHFDASFVIGSGGYAASALLFEARTPRVISGAALSLAAGVGKELVDLTGLGDPSWRDLTWDLLGAAVGVTLSWLIDTVIAGPAPSQRVWRTGSPTNR